MSKSPVEEDRYADIKCVQEACGTAYLAVLKAVDEYLLKKGISKKELPQSVDDYRAMLRKYLTTRNGKLLKDFEALYKELHISGYYRGNLEHVEIVKAAFKIAKSFINKIEQWRVIDKILNPLQTAPITLTLSIDPHFSFS